MRLPATLWTVMCDITIADWPIFSLPTAWAMSGQMVFNSVQPRIREWTMLSIITIIFKQKNNSITNNRTKNYNFGQNLNIIKYAVTYMTLVKQNVLCTIKSNMYLKTLNTFCIYNVNTFLCFFSWRMFSKCFIIILEYIYCSILVILNQ